MQNIQYLVDALKLKEQKRHIQSIKNVKLENIESGII